MTTEPLSQDTLQEIDLLRRVAQKDHSSFRELYDRYFGIILATTLKVLQDERDAEDVTQEVFSMLWQKAYLYESSKGKPMTWVATMARNRAIDRLRSRQRRSRLQTDFERETKGRGVKMILDSSEEVVAKERNDILKKAMLELSKDQQEAIQLAFFQSLTQSEVAERLGEPLGTVKARIRRGVMRLRDLVDGRL